MRPITTVLALCALTLFAGTAPAQKDLEWKAHDFELTDTAGKKHKLSALGNKIVVLEWISHECPFVKRHYGASGKEPGAMQKLSAKYRKKGVVWLAIDSSFDHAPAAVKKMVADWKIKHPVLLDKDGKVGKLYDARTTPHVYVIQGKKILYQGAVDDGPRGNAKTNHLAAALDLALAGKPVAKKSSKPYGCGIKYKK